MGETRNGARTFLNVMAKACQLSRMRGFRAGLNRILGATQGEAVWNLWDPLCQLIDSLIGFDNFFNQIDTAPEQDDDEDVTLG